MKPNLLIVGVARCGTTSLYNYLNQHPEINFSKIKEPKYFSRLACKYPFNGIGDNESLKNTLVSRKKYLDLFSKFNKSNIIAEASSDYFYYHKKTIPLIKAELGTDTKIIICLRNPIHRSLSSYHNLLRDSREKLSFREALKRENERIKANYYWMWHYANGSLYSDGVLNFKNNFKSVYVFILEDFEKNKNKILKDIFSFLNVDDSFICDTNQKYSVSGKPKNKFYKLLTSRVGILRHIRNFIVTHVNRSILEKFSSHMFKKERIDIESKNKLRNFFNRDINKLKMILNNELEDWK